MKPTKLLTKKQREHLKEMNIRCTVPAIRRQIEAMVKMYPDKLPSQVCSDCAAIAHRLNII